MKRTVYGFVLILLLMSSWGWAKDEKDRPELYLTKGGKLKGRIVVRVEQEGFAGVTGHVWTCEPTGDWTVARFVNERMRKPYRTGKLDRKTLEKMMHVFANEDFMDLPSKMGRKVSVNRKLISISFGEKKTACTLNPGERLDKVQVAKDHPKAEVWKRFIAIHRTIEKQWNAKSDKNQDPNAAEDGKK